jgi:hypothetical protein
VVRPHHRVTCHLHESGVVVTSYFWCSPLCVLAACCWSANSRPGSPFRFVYIGICFPLSGQSRSDRTCNPALRARLPLTLRCFMGIYLLLWRDHPVESSQPNG